MMAHSGSESTDLGDVVRIVVPGIGPYGITFEEGPAGNAAAVRAWNRLIDGKFGPVQRHGGVRLGDILIAINDTPLDNIPFQQVLRILQDDSDLKKVLHFTSPDEFQRRLARKSQVSLGGAPRMGSSPSFVSVIKRSRVNKEASTQFAEYEVVCTLRTLSRRVQQERVHKWSVWRRYSQFETLNGSLQALLGWQMENVTFPSKNVFVYNKLSVDFVEKRRQDLDTYWQKVMSMPRITDFQKHYCSPELKLFLEVDAHAGVESGSRSPPARISRSSRQSTQRLRHKAQRKKPSSRGSPPTSNYFTHGADQPTQESNAIEKASSPAPIFHSDSDRSGSALSRQSSIESLGEFAPELPQPPVKKTLGEFAPKLPQPPVKKIPQQTNMTSGGSSPPAPPKTTERRALLADINALRKD